jgi:hypothetical protein
MNTDYNKKHHLQLLKERSMGMDVKENQLSDYNRILERQIEWEMRDQYVELMEGVLNGNICDSEFFAELRTKNYSIMDTFEFLVSHQILLSPHKKALEFGELLEPINDLLEGEELYLTEVEFKNSVEEIYLKIQNFLKEE